MTGYDLRLATCTTGVVSETVLRHTNQRMALRAGDDAGIRLGSSCVHNWASKLAAVSATELGSPAWKSGGTASLGLLPTPRLAP